MATIKIDRGFTQKIQQKGLIHSPSEPPQRPHHPSSSSKSKRAARRVPVAVWVCGAAVLLLAAIAVLLSLTGKTKPPQPRAEAARQTAAAPQPKPESKQTAATTADGLPADPEAELYARHPGTPSPQTAVPQGASATPKPATPPPSQALLREIPLGSPQGLRVDYFTGIPGKSVQSIRTYGGFPDRPSRTVQIGAFELSENVGESYGARIRGFLTPPASGAYRFSVAADDATELWLSRDDTPAHARRLVAYEAWIDRRQWEARSDQQSPACELTAGQRYYIEAFLKENTGQDYLAVAWKGPSDSRYTPIDARYLQPWTEAAPPASRPDPLAAGRAREAALAPARAAIDEQWRKHAAAYRYTAAADALKAGKAAWRDTEPLTLVENAILRFELLARLRAFVQTEVARTPVRAVWTAFGGAPADVTDATDEGVTVAPGRIIEWAKIPPEQMLRLIQASLGRASVDSNTKGILLLAAAVFCKEVTGGLEPALKHRERALALYAGLAPVAERVLGGTPESLQAEVRLRATRDELARHVAAAAVLAARNERLRTELATLTGLVPGVLAERWDQNPYGNLNEARAKGLLKRAPDVTRVLAALESPPGDGERFVSRLRAYLVPDRTDDYYFYIAADDQGEFWLSPDETPEKLALIVKTDTYTNARAWDREKRRSAPVALVQGRHYCIEAFLREGEKQDHLAVAWSPVATDEPRIVTASNLLYAATAGFTPETQELRNRIEADLLKALDPLREVNAIQAAEQERSAAGAPASSAAAEAFSREAARARECLSQAEERLRLVETALRQLQAACAPPPLKTP